MSKMEPKHSSEGCHNCGKSLEVNWNTVYVTFPTATDNIYCERCARMLNLMCMNCRIGRL